MLSVFEGPLCCNTGVCGTDPDQALIDFTADLAWLQRQGIEVLRANLAQDPVAFAESDVARAFVEKVGSEGLPLVVVDGVTVATGRYPSRDELARFAGLEMDSPSSSCCSGKSSSEAACCGEIPVSVSSNPEAVSL